MNWQIMAVFLVANFFLFAGCKSDDLDAPVTDLPGSQDTTLAARASIPTDTNTPKPTLGPTDTPTATPSPTPSSTPTPTAVPIDISGNPRAAILSNPEPLDDVRCGVVDLLDFPLDPPDALRVSYGGQGFGRFRGRYDQYHAGEDWQLGRGRSNLGVPVYAIGHGRVTYAQPLGWGRDQGVIIIRHTFADGSTVLSFYGHMDPDSVILRSGDCVVRGQKIAEIGQPRTPPHLHFEMRTHMPNEPGPGYWPVDPTEAGWLPPSQFIWNNRMASMPGVVWTRPFTGGGAQNLNLVNGDTLVAVEDSHLIGLSATDGHLSWQRAISETVVSAIVDDGRSMLYTANWSGQVTAYPLIEAADGTTTLSADPLWWFDSKMVGSPSLQPLPGGGLVVSVRQELAALSPNGDVLWREEIDARPSDWLLTNDRLIMTTSSRKGPIYSVEAAGIQEWPTQLNGRPISVDDQIWLYSIEGLYRLDPAVMTADLLYLLPQSFFGLGSIVALPDGGAIIAHRELDDSRLIAFNPDGTVQWQRSFAQLEARELRLLIHQDKPYLLTQSGSGLSSQLRLYALDVQDSTLHHIFSGGSRTSFPDGDWFASSNDDLLLINVGGGSMVALDPNSAVALIDPSAD